MMDTIGWNYGFSALWAIHILSVIVFFTGVIFFIVLAIKTFTPAQLKGWAIWLMVIGTIACLATIAIIGRPWIMLYERTAGMGNMQTQQMGQMMEMMMKHNGGANSEDQEEHGDMMQMMRMMMGKGMMGASGGIDDLTDSDSSSAIIDEHHESSSSLSR